MMAGREKWYFCELVGFWGGEAGLKTEELVQSESENFGMCILKRQRKDGDAAEARHRREQQGQRSALFGEGVSDYPLQKVFKVKIMQLPAAIVDASGCTGRDLRWTFPLY